MTGQSTCRPCLEVAAAVIVRERRLLLAQRAPGSHLAGDWEFAGGKLLPGETLEQCICREIHEELGLAVTAVARLGRLEHAYADKTIRLHFLDCRLQSQQEPVCHVHAQCGWFSVAEALLLPLASADRRFLEQHAAKLQDC